MTRHTLNYQSGDAPRPRGAGWGWAAVAASLLLLALNAAALVFRWDVTDLRITGMLLAAVPVAAIALILLSAQAPNRFERGHALFLVTMLVSLLAFCGSVMVWGLRVFPLADQP
jgi:4-hydroxybenzoate polyprenyltransferase